MKQDEEAETKVVLSKEEEDHIRKEKLEQL
jgi:hypothetical protein